MKLRLFIEGAPIKRESSEFLRAMKGPLWCEITFVGDGTRGSVEFLFRGDYYIWGAEELAQMEMNLGHELGVERSDLKAGKTICDGKTIILTSEKVILQAGTFPHVAATARSVGEFVMEWPEPPPPEMISPEPERDPELEKRIEAAKEYQRQLRAEYRRTGKPPTNDPIEFCETVEKRPGQLDAMLARRRGLHVRNRPPEPEDILSSGPPLQESKAEPEHYLNSQQEAEQES